MATKSRARLAYEELQKYFTNVARDAYYQSALGSEASGKKIDSDKVKFLIEIYEDIFGESTDQANISQIAAKMQNLNGDSSTLIPQLKERFCVTPFSKNSGFDKSKIPLNLTSDRDQGSGRKELTTKPDKDSKNFIYKNEPGDHYTIGSIFGKEQDSMEKSGAYNISAVQSWLAETPVHAITTDIIALYLSSITSVAMSRAVPYVDILVSTGINDQEVKTTSPFSLGRFLGFGVTDTNYGRIDSATFADEPGASVVDQNLKVRKLNKSAVASMEIFTSPQTMVNAENGNLKYDENNRSSSKFIDPFRPYMSLDSFDVQIMPSGYGFIQKKTAGMKITLFDKSRLSTIAMLVSPLAYNSVQFDITYGWSHPSGQLLSGRQSDSQFNDQLGKLIDAMRVTDTFTVVNNSFTFNKDGSVSIDLKLVSTGMQEFQSRTMSFTSESPNVKNIKRILDELSTKMTDAQFKALNIPVTALSSFDGFIGMDIEQVKKLRSAVTLLGKKKDQIAGNSDVAALLAQLVGTGEKSGKKSPPEAGLLGSFHKSREQDAKDFIEELKNTPDPFLAKMVGFGVTDSVLQTKPYASLGKILMRAIGRELSEAGSSEVMFVFGPFNENAAAVRDLNTAQFPILLEGSGDEVNLLKVLTDHYKRKTMISPGEFLSLVISNFIDFQGSAAYGLTDIFKANIWNSKENKAAFADSIKKTASKEGSSLLLENLMQENLRRIYGSDSVTDARLTLPKLSMEIVSRRNIDTGKNVIRVNVFDAATDPTKSIGEMLTDILRLGFVLDPPSSETLKKQSDYSISGRIPQHGRRLANFLQEMQDKKILQPFKVSDDDINQFSKKSDGSTNEDQRKLLLNLKSNLENDYSRALIVNRNSVKSIEKMRNLFYDYFPTLIVGSMGSGIIEASLSSQQNDALKTISISKAINQKSEGVDPEIDYGMVLYPTQLSLEVFGTPFFKYVQRFFIDFGTNTSADNFYMVVGASMSFSPGNFKTSLNMAQHDIFGRTINLRKASMEGAATLFKLRQELKSK